MTAHRELDRLYALSDTQFFKAHLDRFSRIRQPWRDVGVTECNEEFNTLGPHDRGRRRIVVYRVPDDNPLVQDGRIKRGLLLKIPFLAFADETIEDRDDVLLPVIDEIMRGKLD